MNSRIYAAFFLAFVLAIPSVLAKKNWNCPFDYICGGKRLVCKNTLSLDLFNYLSQLNEKEVVLNMSSLNSIPAKGKPG